MRNTIVARKLDRRAAAVGILGDRCKIPRDVLKSIIAAPADKIRGPLLFVLAPDSDGASASSASSAVA
jgi:hypothetical protein